MAIDRRDFLKFAGAGFATGGMAQMFERLDSASTVADSGAFPYLRTHPLTLERISEARNRVMLGSGPAPQTTLQHALMQARARVLMDERFHELQILAPLHRRVEQLRFQQLVEAQ